MPGKGTRNNKGKNGKNKKNGNNGTKKANKPKKPSAANLHAASVAKKAAAAGVAAPAANMTIADLIAKAKSNGKPAREIYRLQQLAASVSRGKANEKAQPVSVGTSLAKGKEAYARALAD